MGKLSSSHFTEAETCTPGAGCARGAHEGGAWPGGGCPEPPRVGPPVLPPAASSPYLTPPRTSHSQPHTHTLRSRPRAAPAGARVTHPCCLTRSKRPLGASCWASQDHEHYTAQREAPRSSRQRGPQGSLLLPGLRLGPPRARGWIAAETPVVPRSLLRPDIWLLFHARVVSLHNEQMRRKGHPRLGLKISQSAVHTGPGPPDQAQRQGHSPLTPHSRLISAQPGRCPTS